MLVVHFDLESKVIFEICLRRKTCQMYVINLCTLVYQMENPTYFPIKQYYSYTHPEYMQMYYIQTASYHGYICDSYNLMLRNTDKSKYILIAVQ